MDWTFAFVGANFLRSNNWDLGEWSNVPAGELWIIWYSCRNVVLSFLDFTYLPPVVDFQQHRSSIRPWLLVIALLEPFPTWSWTDLLCAYVFIFKQDQISSSSLPQMVFCLLVSIKRTQTHSSFQVIIVWSKVGLDWTRKCRSSINLASSYHLLAMLSAFVGILSKLQARSRKAPASSLVARKYILCEDSLSPLPLISREWHRIDFCRISN